LTQYFTVNTAVGYLSASDKRLLAGLGADSTAKLVEIQWPSGIIQKFENVKAGQTLKAIEPGAMIRPRIITRRKMITIMATAAGV